MGITNILENMMNILVLSAGTRDKVVRYFKETLKGKGNVIATDCSNLAPAIYDADKAYIVPRIDAPDYIDKVIDICKKEKIDGVFSLIDPELSLIAKERARFEEVGTKVIVSDFDLCEMSLDKYAMYEFLVKKGISTGKCYIDKESFYAAKAAGEVSYPVFVKPRLGSASLNINMVNTDEEIDTLFDIYDDLMIQEYMKGQEYGADIYIDMVSGKCVSIFLKKKIKMRAGETDKSVSVKDEELFKKLAVFAEDCGYRGMIDADLFLDEGKWYLSEINPRFGGGYPHAYECGVNFPKLVINNLEGKENAPAIGDYKEGIYMMKYNDLLILPESELV